MIRSGFLKYKKINKLLVKFVINNFGYCYILQIVLHDNYLKFVTFVNFASYNKSLINIIQIFKVLIN